MLRKVLTAAAALAATVFFSIQAADAQQRPLPRQPAQQQQAQQARIALVLGNAAYPKGPLQTALADGGLVAEALQSIGFEIVEGADTNLDDMRRVFDEFVQKVQAAGPDTIAFVYYSGYAFEFEGDNYLVPVSAQLNSEADIPNQAVKLFDVLGPLADAPAKTKIIVLDATRPIPFQIQGAEIAGGLGAIEAAPGMLVAFSSSPGTTAEDGQGPYGSYATAIAEMVREPGLDIDTLFARIRLRTNEATNGAQTPWEVSQLQQVAMLVPGQAAAPPPGAPQGLLAAPQGVIGAPVVRQVAPPRPLDQIGPEEAYAYAVQRDELPVYVDYVRLYPNSPYAQRVWATIRARREALLWRRALLDNTPDAYWTYLQRYPDGIYVWDARRRLRRLAAAEGPPAGFRMRMYDDVPMPLAGEPGRFLRVMPPAPPPRRWLAPPPSYIVRLPPPSRPGTPGLWRRPQNTLPVIVNPPPRRGPPPAIIVNQPPAGVQPGFGGPPKAWQKPGTGIGAVPPGPPQGFKGQQFQKKGPVVVNQPPPGQPPGPPPQTGFGGPPKGWQKPGTGIGNANVNPNAGQLRKGPPAVVQPQQIQRVAPPPPPVPPRVAAPPPPKGPPPPPPPQAGFSGPPKQFQKPGTGIGPAGAAKGLPKCALVGNKPPCQP